MPNYTLNSLNTVQLPEFQAYTDKYGMTQIDGSTSDNGNLFTAHYAYGLVERKIITDNEKKRILQVYRNNFMEKGLQIRSPHDFRSNAQDDIYGLMSVEAMFFLNPKDRLMTKEIYEYGKTQHATGVDDSSKERLRDVPAFITKICGWFKVKPEDMTRGWLNRVLYKPLKVLGFGKLRWNWNQEKPRQFEAGQWLGRFPQLIATMQMAQGRWVTPWRWLYWAGSMLMLAKNWDTGMDSYTLRIHSAKACQGYGPLTNLVCWAVRKTVAKRQGDFGTVCAKYFGPNHPLVKLLTGIV